MRASQVSDTKGLAVDGQASQKGANSIRGIAANSGIDFVKDLGLCRVAGPGCNLDGKADAGQLTAGGDFA